MKPDFLEIGYKAGVVLSFLGIIASAAYLFSFLWVTSSASEIASHQQLLGVSFQTRLMFLSTGIFVGMSFGFLGFALFLIQAKGDLDLSASVDDYKLKIARLSPGLFVILCATVIITTCATFRINYQIPPAQAVMSKLGDDGVQKDSAAEPETKPDLRQIPPEIINK